MYRALVVVLFAGLVSSCAQRRDFGCLIDGYSVAAPSGAELALMAPDGTMVLERYVDQVGVAPGHLIALCKVPANNQEQPQKDETPCAGYNVIDTRSGAVVRGLSKERAIAMLEATGSGNPEMKHISEYFSVEWPPGQPGAFCKAHPEFSPLR